MLLASVILSIVWVAGLLIRQQHREVPLKSLSIGWKMLWLTGIFFIPGGFVWLLKWIPTSGPYMVGEKYPFGGYIEAWEVSMGFAFVAFGILFSSCVILASRTKSRSAWNALLLSWVLLMFPHALIGITFPYFDPTLKNLGVSRYAIPFSIGWLAITIIGFIKSNREIISDTKN